MAVIQSHRLDEEVERRYYQGPSERISLNNKAEYMTASFAFAKNDYLLAI